MPNQTKNYKAVNNSTRTVRSSAKKTSLNHYQVSLRTVGIFASDYKSGVYSTKIYQATSKEEAIGMACDYIGQKFPFHTIMMNETECKQLKALPL